MKIVVIAGGQGTRIASVNSEIPKAMIPVEDKPILEYDVELAKRYGYTDFIFIVGYMGDQIESYFGSGKKWGVHIEYFREEKPLGTAGALGYLKDKLTDDFFVFYGDTIMDFDMQRMLEYHHEKNADATLFLHPNDHPYDSDIVELDKDGKVCRFFNKPHSEDFISHNVVNAALFIFSPKILEKIKLGIKSHIEKNILPACLDADMNLFGYISFEYIKDMGTPDRYYSVCGDVRSGKVARLNRKNPRVAVFLDRDGTINKEVHFLSEASRMELLDGAAEAIRHINEKGYLAVVVTNQPVIARGECTWDELNRINMTMETALGKKHAYLNAIYVCPHHPDKGFEGERVEYKKKCDCRKPEPGMLRRAAGEWNIDIANSYMIGDSERDVEAGKAAGCKDSIKIETNKPFELLKTVKKLLDI